MQKPGKDRHQICGNDLKMRIIKVLQDLKPDLVVVLGKQLAKNLPAPVDGITFCKVNHPSSGFKYEDHAQSLMNAIEDAKKMKLLDAAVV